MYELTSPSEVARCAFFAAAACPFLRRMFIACSMSPLDSSKASRQAVNPAPVRSRNSLTSCAEIFEFPGVAISILFLLIEFELVRLRLSCGTLQSCFDLQAVITACAAFRLQNLLLPQPRRSLQPPVQRRVPRNRLPASRKLHKRSCPRNPQYLRRRPRKISGRQFVFARRTDVLPAPH